MCHTTQAHHDIRTGRTGLLLHTHQQKNKNDPQITGVNFFSQLHPQRQLYILPSTGLVLSL